MNHNYSPNFLNSRLNIFGLNKVVGLNKVYKFSNELNYRSRENGR